MKHVEELSGASDVDATHGWEAYQRGDLESARSDLLQAGRKQGARPWVHYALGQSSFALRRFDEAISSWEKVQASTPEFKPVYFDLVDAYISVGNLEKAEEVLRIAIGRWPSDAEVANALGAIQTHRDEINDAIRSFERAVKNAPDQTLGYFNLGRAYEIRFNQSRIRDSRFRHTTPADSSAGKPDRAEAVKYYHRYLELGGGPLSELALRSLKRLEIHHEN